jgi:hypothetical protein
MLDGLSECWLRLFYFLNDFRSRPYLLAQRHILISLLMLQDLVLGKGPLDECRL